MLTDGVDDRFGADGPGPCAGIVSITVDGFIYTYDADLDQITSTNPTIAGATLDVSTALGGHLTFHFEAGFGFETGDYSYAPPADVEAGTVETFHYIIADADGDQAEADLVITIQESQSPAPIVERGLDTSSWPGDDLGMAEIFEDESGSAGGANSMPATSLDPVPGAITTVLEDAANASQVAAT